jgi:hypothetical protein
MRRRGGTPEHPSTCGRPSGGDEASPWITLLKSKAMSNMYIRLLCRYDPESVLGYLQRADYDVEECLECCRASGHRAAQAATAPRKHFFSTRWETSTPRSSYISNVHEIPLHDFRSLVQ